MNAGGAETFLMKMFRSIDKTKYQFDFCVNLQNNFYQDEIKNMGGKIYVIPAKSTSIIGYVKELRKIIKNNNYEYVIRVNEHSLSVLDLLIARSSGAKRLIMRSSNAGNSNRVSKLLHDLFKFLPILIPDVKIAPSRKAAEYTFGKAAVRKGEVKIIHNGLDIEKFKFSEMARNEYRNKLGIDDKIAIGHVGRFYKQKNHKFLIQTFAEIVRLKQNAVLVLIGDGDLKDEIINESECLDVREKIIFLGTRQDVNYLLMAMDILIFPSFYEGMPNAVIEAQATGLPCIISDTITEEADITGNVIYYSLNRSPYDWAKETIRMLDNQKSRQVSDKLYENGYDIQSVTALFQKIIFE